MPLSNIVHQNIRNLRAAVGRAAVGLVGYRNVLLCAIAITAGSSVTVKVAVDKQLLPGVVLSVTCTVYDTGRQVLRYRVVGRSRTGRSCTKRCCCTVAFKPGNGVVGRNRAAIYTDRDRTVLHNTRTVSIINHRTGDRRI